VGVDIVKHLYLNVSTATITTHKSYSSIKVFNPFVVPLQFVGIVAEAKATVNSKQVSIGKISQDTLGNLAFTVPPLADTVTAQFPAETNLPVPTLLAILKMFAASPNVPVEVSSTSHVQIGEYPATVTLNRVVEASLLR
jgi:hypothetical protein